VANVLRRPTRWTRQPPGPVRIAAAWRSRVEFAYSGQYAQTKGGFLQPDSRYSGNAGIQSCIAGQGYRFSGNASDYVRFNTGVTPAEHTAFSLEFIVVGSSFPSLAALCGLDVTAATDGSFGSPGATRGFLSFQSTDPCNIYFWGGNNDLDSGVKFTVNTVQHIFATRPEGASANLTIYRNGVQIASAANTNLGASGPYFYLGGRHTSASATLNGVIAKATFYNAVLTAAEVAALSRNPWSTYEPIRRAIFFAGGLPAATGTAAAVGGATTKAAGVGNTVGSGKAVGGATTKAAGVGVTVGTAAARGGGAAKATGSGSSIGTGTAAAVAGGSAKAAGASAKLGAGKAVAGGAAKAAGAATHSGTAAAVGGAAAKAVGAAPLPPSEVDHYIQGWPVNAAGAVIVHVVP